MIKRVLLLLLVAVLVVPAVSALEVIYDEPITEYITTSKTGIQTNNPTTDKYYQPANYITFKDITKAQDLKYLVIEINGDKGVWRNGTKIREGTYNFTYRFGQPGSGFDYPEYRGVLNLERKIDSSGQVASTIFTIYFPEWDIGSLTGQQTIKPISPEFCFDYDYLPTGTVSSDTNAYVHWGYYRPISAFPIKITEVSGIDWKHHLKVLADSTTYYFDINGFIDGQHFTSEVVLKRAAKIYSNYTNPGERLELAAPKSEIDLLEIISPSGTRYVYPLFGDIPVDPGVYPVTVYVYDAETRLPLSGDWEYYVVIQGADSVSGSASGPSTVLYLPETSILNPHLIRITKEGYEQVAPMMFGVPVGGRELHIYLTPLETVAPDGSSVVTFVVTDIETGEPVRNCLVNVDGIGKFAGASGTVQFVFPEHTTHQWVATADGYWPIGGNFTLGEDDLTIPVEMTKKTSDLPRPPLPDLPNFPVVPPSLDPASFRMLILNVPYLGDMAEPLLDVIDAIAAGVDDIASSVLDFLTAPADLIVRAMQGISSQLVSVSKAFLDAAAIVLDSLGMLIAVIPTKVVNLITFAMILDIIILLLRGGL